MLALRRTATRALAGACLLVVLSGCAGAGSGAPQADALVAERRTESAAPHDAAAPGGPAASAPQAAPLDPEAPATPRPVVRPGRTAVLVPVAALRSAPGAPVRYADGVSVTVERIARTVEQGQGPGSFPGRPLTALTLLLRNGSPRPVDVSQVVVTTRYGQRPRSAAPVYDAAGATDFTGTVAPGGVTRATYVFALPPGRVDDVSAWVDVDGAHAAAVPVGTLR